MDDTQTNNADSDLQIELEQTKQKLEEMTTISQRSLADLQNFKRRNEEEKATFIAFANAALFTELLPAIDNIHRTLTHETKDEEWIKGEEQTMKQILQICQKTGLNEIPAQVGEPFDPTKHEALLTAPGPKDQILEILENGYMLETRIIKPTRVKVGNGEATS